MAALRLLAAGRKRSVCRALPQSLCGTLKSGGALARPGAAACVAVVCACLAWMASSGAWTSEAGAAADGIVDQVRDTYRQLRALGAPGTGDGNADAISYTIIYSDAEGRSHFGVETRNLNPVPETADGLGSASATQPFLVDFATLVSLPPGARTDWHPAVQRTLNLVMSGAIEITVSDETRRFGPGDFFIGFDPGIGHISANPGDQPLRMLVAPISAPSPD